MGTTRKTITLSAQQAAWVRSRVASGDYANDSEYFGDLIRRDQDHDASRVALAAAIQEGLGSGLANRSLRQIMEYVEARLTARGRI